MSTDEPQPKLVTLWTQDSGRTRSFETKASTTAMAFDLSGKKLALGGPGGAVEIWDVQSAKRLETLRSLRARITAIGFRRGRLAVGTDSGELSIYRRGVERSLSGHRQRIWKIAWGENGNLLATASADGTARVFHVAAPDKLPSEPLGFNTHPTEHYPAMQLSRDGSKALWSTEATPGRRLFILADMDTGETQRFEVGKIGFGQLSADGSTVLVPRGDYAVAFRDGKQVKLADESTRWTSKGVTLSADGKTAWVADGELVRIWNIASAQELRAIDVAAEQLSVSPNGKRLIIANRTSTELYDLATGSRTPISVPATYKNEFTWSADSRYVIIETNGRLLWVLEVKTAQITSLQSDSKDVTQATMSHDNRLVAASASRKIWLWDLATGVGHGFAARDVNRGDAVAFSPDGTRIIVFSKQTTTTMTIPVFEPADLAQLTTATIENGVLRTR